MLTIKLEESKIKEIAKKANVDRKAILTYPYGDLSEPLIYLNKAPRAFLEVLKNFLPAGDKTRIVVENFLTPHEEVLSKTAKDIKEAAALLGPLTGRGDALGIQVGKLRFPVTIGEPAIRDDMWGNRITVGGSFHYGDVSSSTYRNVYPDHVGKEGEEPNTLAEILSRAKFITFDKTSYAKHAEAVGRAHRIQTEMSGKLVRIKGPVYVKPRWGDLPVEVRIGNGEKKAIIEDELEADGTMWYNETEEVNEIIPLVRIFLLERKAYCYVHVDNIVPHVYDKDGFQKVVMPDKVRTLFEQVFSAGPEMTFGDLFGGRHGGTVILADGPPGVGKTLTAEAVAELSERPLYVADVGEIGIDLDTVEDKLKTILDRASKWNAVLLLDEADIFLVKRDVDNIERNAIVGTFLKFLDGFDGTLFLTTNRVEVIDPAFASRITARIHYSALDSAARSKIWERMIEAAKLNLPKSEIPALAEKKMNGRQIRNVVRLAKMFYRDKQLSKGEIAALDEHILRVEETWETPGAKKETE